MAYIGVMKVSWGLGEDIWSRDVFVGGVLLDNMMVIVIDYSTTRIFLMGQM